MSATRQKLIAEQEREQEIMQGASVETIINGRAYTWLEPSAADRRLMLGDIIDVQMAMGKAGSRGRGLMMCFNFLTAWHSEIENDMAYIDAVMFGGDTAACTALGKEIAQAFTAVAQMVQRPFVKTKDPPGT